MEVQNVAGEENVVDMLTESVISEVLETHMAGHGGSPDQSDEQLFTS